MSRGLEWSKPASAVVCSAGTLNGFESSVQHTNADQAQQLSGFT
jgi:hypothetical protein